MPKRIDITGRRFGRLLVIEFSKVNSWHEAVWRCRCDCGVEKFVNGSALRSENTRSCGCWKNELIGARKRTHGQSNKNKQASGYSSWRAMRERCCSPTHADYKDYGGRGITICARWNKFESFFADMGPRPEGMWLGRINNDLGYFPMNCRWETPVMQANNRRKHKAYPRRDKVGVFRSSQQRISVLDFSLVLALIFSQIRSSDPREQQVPNIEGSRPHG
jgi:hypothetical protein